MGCHIRTFYYVRHLTVPELFRAPKILKMPPAKQNNDENSVKPLPRTAQLSTDRDEESASVAKISKWLELADAVLTGAQGRKRA